MTFALLGANVAVWLLMLLHGRSTAPETLLWFGAKEPALVLGGQYWRLITSMFVHIGILHLGFNMWALFVLGGLLENIYGRRRFLALYVLAGLGGSIASMAWSPSLSAGASGALFGLASAAVVLGTFHPSVIPRRFNKEIVGSLLPVIGYNLVIGAISPLIDNFAHLGGLVVGIAYAALAAPEQPGRAPKREVEAVIAGWTSAAVLAAAFTGLAITWVRPVAAYSRLHTTYFADPAGCYTMQRPIGWRRVPYGDAHAWAMNAGMMVTVRCLHSPYDGFHASQWVDSLIASASVPGSPARLLSRTRLALPGRRGWRWTLAGGDEGRDRVVENELLQKGDRLVMFQASATAAAFPWMSGFFDRLADSVRLR